MQRKKLLKKLFENYFSEEIAAGGGMAPQSAVKIHPKTKGVPSTKGTL